MKHILNKTATAVTSNDGMVNRKKTPPHPSPGLLQFTHTPLKAAYYPEPRLLTAKQTQAGHPASPMARQIPHL